jgi:hypothetical protein
MLVKTRGMVGGVECPKCGQVNTACVNASYNTPMPDGTVRCSDQVLFLCCELYVWYGWTEHTEAGIALRMFELEQK